jgi:hypothetical protein
LTSETKTKSKLEKVLDIIQKEPNYETFEYKGFKIVIKRMMYLGGQLNGYVRLPEEHKYYQKGYNDIPIECHGGLTFTGDLEEDGDFYIGFDTAHYRDYIPFLQFHVSNSAMMDELAMYKDITYVRNECKQIVEQLIEQ